MRVGITGPPQSGKTTLFKILLQADVSGNVGVFRIPDNRVEKVSELFSSKKTTYPEFTFVDLGPLSTFTKKDISKLQDIDLFLCVIGTFFIEDPKRDIESCLMDIILSDLDVIEIRLGRLQKERRGAGKEVELEVLRKCQRIVSDGRLLYKGELNRDELKLLSSLLFLSLKPLVVALNVSEDDRTLEGKLNSLEEYCSSRKLKLIKFYGKTELELLEIAPEERKKFAEGLGVEYNFRERLSKLLMSELDLITFITTGDKETRGWFLKSGSPVIEAAGKIHTDMKRGFIRAEVINFEDFVRYGSMHKARAAGVLKVEGKEYIVKDGDIINIRFSV